MRKAIEFNVTKDGYDIDRVQNPMTVGKLKEMFEGLDDDTEIILSYDDYFGTLKTAKLLKQDNDDESYYLVRTV